MPDDRFFHKRAGHSDKVNQLTDAEELIWRYYVLSADDFGVMKFTPAQIRTDHERAEKKPERVVMRALERSRDVGLIHTFEHQGRTYCYSRNWQKHQKVSYPRETILPCPPAAELSQCEPTTRFHFAAHPGGKEGLEKQKVFPKSSLNDSPSVPEIVSERFPLACAGVSTHANAEAESSGQGFAREDFPSRAGAFCAWYAETHERLIKAGYIGNPRKDYEAALQMVRKFSDIELQEAATVWFGQRDAFAVTGTRTVTKFASRASALVIQAREVAS